MKEILRKRAKEKRDAEIIMAIQAKKIQNLTKTNYFKPNQFIEEASHFNKVPINKQYRERSVNMINEVALKNSMKATLRQTDVWREDALKFKLIRSGASVERRSRGSISPSSSLGGRKLTH